VPIGPVLRVILRSRLRSSCATSSQVASRPLCQASADRCSSNSIWAHLQHETQVGTGPQPIARFADQQEVRMNFIFILSLALVIVSIVGIFASIPIISDYAFWFAIGAYVVLAGSKV